MKFIGLDAGSVSVKLVLLDEKGAILEKYYLRHKGHPVKIAYELLKGILSRFPHSSGFSLSLTGSSGKLISESLGTRFTNEVVAQSYAAKKLYPGTRTIIELGGEDSKLIVLGEKGLADFSMNSVCAAGTGSFLDQQAERLKLSIEDFSELALKSRPARIAGRCSVFAKSDMIHLQQIATPVEEIVAGLCFAVARNFKGAIVRGRSIEEPVSFHGGVAANRGMVRAFEDVFGFRELFVPGEHALTGALGAALKDMDEGVLSTFDLGKLEALIRSSRFSTGGHKKLISAGDEFFQRHPQNSDELIVMSNKLNDKNQDSSPVTHHASRITAFLGIDIGSISTNLAVTDESGRLLAKRYLMTAGRPIEAVNRGLAEIGDEIGGRVNIMGVGTTGSGRYMIADYVGADIVKNEITAQATAAIFIDKDVDTIFEIGGQDSKYISLRDGVIVDFEMNKACAAGTGSFLEEQAEKLNISVKHEFAESAFCAENPCRLGERCTVFMENSLMANLQKGAEKKELLAGLAYSIVQNYITKVVAGKPVGKHIFFQGGVAFNKAVVAAFEKYVGRDVKVPPHHDVTGAIGMALIAMRHMKQVNSQQSTVNSQELNKKSLERLSTNGQRLSTNFKGFELSKRSYEISSFECKGCPNVCEINRVKIEGEQDHLFYGGRCEKYDVRKKKQSSNIPDLFSFREEMLWKAHNKYSEEFKVKSEESRAVAKPLKIGIPYIFFFHDYLPFWTTLLWELGFDVEVSPKTNREIVHLGSESVLAETCFPVKVAYGHIRYLASKGIDAMLIPSFINMNSFGDEFEKGFACPLTQTIPYAAKVAHPKVRIISPIVNLQEGDSSTTFSDELLKAFKPLGVRKKGLLKAMAAGMKEQEDFLSAIRAKGREVFSSVRGRSLVILGRPYNAFESGMNLNIPKKLSELSVLAIPMDFVPGTDIRIDDKWPNMYWRSGQKILRTARFVKDNPDLHAVFISNFSCGPDSFILKFLKNELHGKPFLQIEIDEHSADAGAVTRCEAFLDSVENRLPDTKKPKEAEAPKSDDILDKAERRRRALGSVSKVRTVFVPNMSDHSFGLAAAFEKCGIPSEVLPESDKEAVDIGRRYVSGKECYPCTVTTGDMLKKVFSPGFSPGESAFFMPSGSGPCRFGQYNVFHRIILDEVGYPEVPIFAPNQDAQFYREFGMVGRDFTMDAWKGIIAYDLLSKCLHETRPYEENKGEADKLYQEYVKKLYLALRGLDGGTEKVLGDIRDAFKALARKHEQRPIIGIVGEIFVRSHRFSNEDLIKKIEALGGEAWLAPLEEWVYYVTLMGTRKALIKKDRSAIIQFLLKRFFQKRIEHRYAGKFRGFLKNPEEPDVKEILKKASAYLHDSFEGEAILSIGKSVDLIGKGVSGIVNAMPFGCMPGTIVSTLMHGIRRDYGIPCLSIPYDGNESPAVEIQLEAFMNQAMEYKKT